MEARTAKGFAGFGPEDAVYLIMPDRFADGDSANDAPPGLETTLNRAKPRAYHGGDLKGIEQHLDYLERLGVTTVWVTPLYDNSGDRTGGSYHGYSATDMYAIDPHLGTVADYRSLAEALHRRGMKMVLDTVPNHVGPKHPWVRDEPLPDWFHGTAAQHIEAVGDFSSIVDPHGSERDRIPPVDGWFANVLPDMNQGEPLVETYLIQNAIWWIETAGLDGLRLDTFPYVNRGFWRDFHAELHYLYPRLTTVGEVFNGDPSIVSYFAGGEAHAGIDTGLYTPFDFPMYFALRDVCVRGAPTTRLAGVLREDSLYPHPERLAPFEGNHDTKRFLSEPGATPEELKLAFGLLGTLRGMPEIYSGDEIAMRGGDDPDNRRDFPGGFPGDKQDAFRAEGRTPEQAAMHDWVAEVFGFRAKHPALQGGDQQEIYASDAVFAFARIGGGEKLLVVANNGSTGQTIRLDLHHTALQGARGLKGAMNSSAELQVRDGMGTVAIAAKALVVFRVY